MELRVAVGQALSYQSESLSNSGTRCLDRAEAVRNLIRIMQSRGYENYGLRVASIIIVANSTPDGCALAQGLGVGFSA